jgi:hypothetical protein
MGLAIEQRHTPGILQQPQRRFRHRSYPRKAVGMIKDAGRLFAHHTDRFAEHQAGLEEVGTIAATSL